MCCRVFLDLVDCGGWQVIDCLVVYLFRCHIHHSRRALRPPFLFRFFGCFWLGRFRQSICYFGFVLLFAGMVFRCDGVEVWLWAI